uniref:replication/maintenance protein RepL n=1 Tax=Niallia taxi TaxID=2499688 RepID=UPI003F491A8A
MIGGEVLVMLEGNRKQMSQWQKEIIQATQKKRVSKETVEKIMDSTTGEVLQERFVQQIYQDKEPNYVKLYIDNLILLNGLPKGTTDTIMELLKYMSYENTIILNSYIKKEIAQSLGFKTVQSLDNNINKLVKKGILDRIGRGTFRANAFLFGKGDWNDIKQIRFEIVFGENGIEQKADFEYREEVASTSEK